MSALDLLLTFVLALSIPLCSFCYVAEFCYRQGIQSRWLPINTQHYLTIVMHLPTFFWILCTVVHVCCIFNLGQAYDGPQLEINPDIAGVGVRVGLYIPQAIAATTLIMGHWHGEPCGIKEICTVQLVSTAYIALNVCKGRQALSFQELVVAVAFLDGVSTVVSMAQSCKETLASRWLVKLCASTEFLALVANFVALSRIVSLPETEGLRMVYWGLIVPGHKLPTSIWLYTLLRSIAFLHTVWLASCFTDIFDCIEKVDRGSVPPMKAKLSYPMNHPKNGSAKAMEQGTESSSRYLMANNYNTMPATVFTRYHQCLPVILSSATAIESFLANIKLQQPGKLTEWGQSTALVTCVATFCHQMYTYWLMSKHEAIERRMTVQDEEGYCEISGLARFLSRRISSKRLPFFQHDLKSMDFARLNPPDNAWWLSLPQKTEEERRRLDQMVLSAVTNRDRIGVREFLRQGASPNARLMGGTASQAESYDILVKAVEGDWQMIDQLISAGAHLHIILRLATEREDLQLIKHLLLTYKELFSPKDIIGGLVIAARKGSIELAEPFISSGVNIDVESADGNFPLQEASKYYQVDMVRFLLENNADPNYISVHGTAIESLLGWEPNESPSGELLEILVTLKLLLHYGANTNLHSGQNGSIIQLALSRNYSLTRDHGRRKREKIIDLLIEHNALESVNFEGGKYHTALQAAAYFKLPYVDVLLRNNAGVTINTVGGEHGTALHALLSSTFDIGRIRTLYVEENEDEDAVGAGGFYGAMDLLLNRGADPNIECKPYGTVLHLALIGMYYSPEFSYNCAESLLRNGANPNIPIPGTIIEFVSQTRYRSDKLGFAGCTVLQLATSYGNAMIVALLVKHGAKIDAPGPKGTALEIAERRGDQKVINLLRNPTAVIEDLLDSHGRKLLGFDTTSDDENSSEELE